MKKINLYLLGLLTAASLTACGSAEEASTADTAAEAETDTASETDSAAETDTTDETDTDSEESVGLANPWTESDKQGVLEATGFELNAPEGATDVTYSYMADENLAQMTYKDGNNDWVYRMEPADQLTDISGMNYEWTVTEEGTVEGREAEYLTYSDATEDTEYLDDVFGVTVINWYDAVTGVTYSLSGSGYDLNGLDFQMYAENIYEPLQGEATADADADAARDIEAYFLGKHERSEDGSYIDISDNGDGTYAVDISITRLCSLENGTATYSEYKMFFTAEDPNGNDISGMIYRDSDNSLDIKITDSTWDYLPVDEVLEGFGK